MSASHFDLAERGREGGGVLLVFDLCGRMAPDDG